MPITHLLHPRGLCIVDGCDCVATYFDDNRAAPQYPDKDCVCGHPFYSHTTSQDELDAVAALNNTLTAAGACPARGCAWFYSVRLSLIALSVSPPDFQRVFSWITAGNPRAALASAAGDGSLTSVLLPWRTLRAPLPWARTIRLALPPPPGHPETHRDPLRLFSRSAPDDGAPNERRNTSIGVKFSPEAPRSVVPRGRKNKSPATQAGSSRTVATWAGFLPAAPDTPLSHPQTEDWLICVRACERAGLVYEIALSNDGPIWRYLQEQVLLKSGLRRIIIPRTRHSSQHAFDSLVYGVVAPAPVSKAKMENTAMVRPWTLIALTSNQYTTANLRQYADRVPNLIDEYSGMPMLLLVPMHGNLEGPGPDDQRAHRCFPFRTLAGTVVLPNAEEIPSCCDLTCISTQLPEAPTRAVRQRPPSAEPADLRPATRCLRSPAPNDDEYLPSVGDLLARAAARRHDPLSPLPESSPPPPDSSPYHFSPHMDPAPRRSPRTAAPARYALPPPPPPRTSQRRQPASPICVSLGESGDSDDGDSDFEFLDPIRASAAVRPRAAAVVPPRAAAVPPRTAAAAVPSRAPAIKVEANDNTNPSVPAPVTDPRMIPHFVIEDYVIDQPPPQEVPQARREEVEQWIQSQGHLFVPQASTHWPTAASAELLAQSLLDLAAYDAPYTSSQTLLESSPGVARPTVLPWRLQKYPLQVKVGNAPGAGPLRATFTAGLKILLSDEALWGRRGPYFIPRFFRANSIMPEHLNAYFLAGRWAGLSIMHRNGAGPDPISPFLLVLAILGGDGLGTLTLDFIAMFDPDAAETLAPLFVLAPGTVVSATQTRTSQLGQLLLNVFAKPRSYEVHFSIHCDIVAEVLLGMPAYGKDHNELDAFRTGFRGIRRDFPDALDAIEASFPPRRPLDALLARMYDCRITSVDQIISRLIFCVDTGDRDALSIVFFQLFSLHVRRWLRGRGHPATPTVVDFVGKDLFNEERDDPLVRARLFMSAMVDSQVVPLDDAFKFQITLRRGLRNLNPPYFHTCFTSCDMRVDGFVENALLEPCDLEDSEDATLFDEWIHKLFFAGDWRRATRWAPPTRTRRCGPIWSPLPAGGGCVYVFVFLQRNEEIAVQAGTAPLGEEVDALDAKVGYVVDVEARREGHEQQCVGVERAWAYYYPTRYPKLLERLVHLTLKVLGAHWTPRPCTGYFCNVRHREFFLEGAAGGLEGIVAIIEAWLRRLGEIPDRRPMYFTN
ncbi:hypothetical protein FB451DRAFT_1414411 [Mycena latifolia]|nr:hypothetical protein FB451DRAFT_1414411 [Mycena latifolia]